MAVEKPTPAELDELETLRAEKAERDREEAGIATGILRCNTPGCPHGDVPADLHKVTHKRIVEETGVVENTVDEWIYDGPGVCDQCEMALSIVPPNATSFFPAGYRYQFGEPVR